MKEFKILLSKLGFQKLNKIFNSQVRFFGYIIIFRSTKMLAQIADLRLCALMSLCPYVPAPLCLRPYVLRPFVCTIISGFVTVGNAPYYGTVGIVGLLLHSIPQYALQLSML